MKITTEMARYIWSIIVANPTLPMSWGVDLFQVSLYNEEGNEVKRIDDVYLDNLAEVIDQNVEMADDYNTKVMNYILGL